MMAVEEEEEEAEALVLDCVNVKRSSFSPLLLLVLLQLLRLLLLRKLIHTERDPVVVKWMVM